ncbi:MAG TPA: MarR family winged helix-turn-helix transcriptional regulator [Gemmatimonadales bacterium]|nr:MarR family winged helix-turn-helix transcriptional regulator [Gemmatimonadales bacterium]
MSPPSEYGAVEHGASQAVLAALRRIMRAIDLYSRQLMQQLGVTAPQLIVLQELARHGRVPAGSLAKRVSLSAATVTGIISRLEKRGLVERREDDTDRRRVLVGVTPEGRQLLVTAPLPIQQSFIREFEALPDWDQSHILSSLQRVVAMMEATEQEAAPIMPAGLFNHATESFDGTPAE